MYNVHTGMKSDNSRCTVLCTCTKHHEKAKKATGRIILWWNNRDIINAGVFCGFCDTPSTLKYQTVFTVYSYFG